MHITYDTKILTRFWKLQTFAVKLFGEIRLPIWIVVKDLQTKNIVFSQNTLEGSKTASVLIQKLKAYSDSPQQDYTIEFTRLIL